MQAWYDFNKIISSVHILMLKVCWPFRARVLPHPDCGCRGVPSPWLRLPGCARTLTAATWVSPHLDCGCHGCRVRPKVVPEVLKPPEVDAVTLAQFHSPHQVPGARIDTRLREAWKIVHKKKLSTKHEITWKFVMHFNVVVVYHVVGLYLKNICN